MVNLFRITTSPSLQASSASLSTAGANPFRFTAKMQYSCSATVRPWPFVHLKRFSRDTPISSPIEAARQKDRRYNYGREHGKDFYRVWWYLAIAGVGGSI